MTRTGAKKLFVFLLGAALGTLILQLIPREKEKRGPHPWHAQTAPEGTYPLNVVDDFGREVTISEQPRWVVSLAPSTTEILFAMEMGDHLSAVTNWDHFPEGAEKLRASGLSIGDLHQPDIERIYSLPADIVIGSKLTPVHLYDKIQRERKPVAIAIEPDSLDDLLQHDLPLFGEVLGVPGKALGLVLALRERRAAVGAHLRAVADAPRCRVVLLIGLEDNLAPGWSPGRNTWAGSLLEEAHGDNLAATLGTEWGQFPLESLLDANPEVLLFKDGETPEAAAELRDRIARLARHPIWQHIDAVKNGRIAILPPGPLSIPGPRMVDALEDIARALWPEAMTSAP